MLVFSKNSLITNVDSHSIEFQQLQSNFFSGEGARFYLKANWHELNSHFAPPPVFFCWGLLCSWDWCHCWFRILMMLIVDMWQIMADPRVRVEQRLRDAGLQTTDYARQVLTQLQPVHLPRRDAESSVFKWLFFLYFVTVDWSEFAVLQFCCSKHLLHYSNIGANLKNRTI